MNSKLLLVLLTCLFCFEVFSAPVSCFSGSRNMGSLSMDDDTISEEYMVLEDIEENLTLDNGNCQDKAVCQLECSYFYPTCTKKLFFDVTPFTRYQPPTNGQAPRGYEEFQAYREVCVRRAGDDTNTANKILFSKVNQKLSEYTGIPVRTIEARLYQGDAHDWNHNYEHILRESSISDIKKGAGEGFIKFLWALRSFKTLCQASTYSNEEVMEKFKVFDAEYRTRMFQAGGADYFTDPGLQFFYN
jgi:hypothetical protein